jgi:dUTP pyrophosphatase
MPKVIKVLYHDPEMPKLGITDKGDWIDLYTAENVLLSAGQYKRISLGVSMELPEGYEALVIPRSSTFEKYGLLLSNSVGLIDESYKGDNDIWQFPAHATRDVFVPKHTRLCQFRILEHQPVVSLQEVAQLGNKNRNGFGSTGR